MSKLNPNAFCANLRRRLAPNHPGHVCGVPLYAETCARRSPKAPAPSAAAAPTRATQPGPASPRGRVRGRPGASTTMSRLNGICGSRGAGVNNKVCVCVCVFVFAWFGGVRKEINRTPTILGCFPFRGRGRFSASDSTDSHVKRIHHEGPLLEVSVMILGLSKVGALLGTKSTPAAGGTRVQKGAICSTPKFRFGKFVKSAELREESWLLFGIPQIAKNLTKQVGGLLLTFPLNTKICTTRIFPLAAS